MIYHSHNTPEELKNITDIKDKIQTRTNEISWIVNSYILDRRAVIYLTHVCISMIMIIFCMYQLIELNECHSQQLYSTLLTLIIGIYLPSPAVRNTKH
jgi:Na+-translocating ferredoxin:NAD+ oxidoreductase RnfA subunit